MRMIVVVVGVRGRVEVGVPMMEVREWLVVGREGRDGGGISMVREMMGVGMITERVGWGRRGNLVRMLMSGCRNMGLLVGSRELDVQRHENRSTQIRPIDCDVTRMSWTEPPNRSHWLEKHNRIRLSISAQEYELPSQPAASKKVEQHRGRPISIPRQRDVLC